MRAATRLAAEAVARIAQHAHRRRASRRRARRPAASRTPRPPARCRPPAGRGSSTPSRLRATPCATGPAPDGGAGAACGAPGAARDPGGLGAVCTAFVLVPLLAVKPPAYASRVALHDRVAREVDRLVRVRLLREHLRRLRRRRRGRRRLVPAARGGGAARASASGSGSGRRRGRRRLVLAAPRSPAGSPCTAAPRASPADHAIASARPISPTSSSVPRRREPEPGARAPDVFASSPSTLLIGSS